MHNILVTGGAGFVGSHLVESLLSDDVSVVVVDDFSNGSRDNLEPFLDRIKLIDFDISNSDWSPLDGFNPDTIFHLATHPRSFSFKTHIETSALTY